MNIKVEEPAELLVFLLANLKDKSRNNIKSLLKREQVLVDNRPVTQFNYQLKKGQEVSISSVKTIKNFSFNRVKIIFEDESIVVIEKDTGLLSVAANGEAEDTAYAQLSEYYKRINPKNKIFVVHRLDKDTSGVMMFAKNQEVQKLLQDNWDETISERVYVAVVEGTLEKDSGTIVSYLKENKSFKMYSTDDTIDGQKAVTHYSAIKRKNNYTLVRLNLETGRKNQIRVHMQDLGHPIVGDKKYGCNGSPMHRLGLHAHILSFIHPVTGKEMSFKSPLPVKFNSLLA